MKYLIVKDQDLFIILNLYDDIVLILMEYSSLSTKRIDISLYVFQEYKWAMVSSSWAE